MKTILFVNACINREKSRTNRLGRELLNLLKEKEEYSVTELVLEEENIQALNSETLEKRLALSKKGEFTDDMFKYAHQMSKSDCIVIAAPYWDLAFPAMLKNYIEATSVVGITYRYSENGRPVGMCKADKVYYVTTCGGYIRDLNLGYDTVKALAALFGIKGSQCIAAEGLDARPNEVEAIMEEAIKDLPSKI
jgi:FMN-dependent NADH-azoreductase